MLFQLLSLTIVSYVAAVDSDEDREKAFNKLNEINQASSLDPK